MVSSSNSRECIHHWLITSAGCGVCKHCWAERQFPTYFEKIIVSRRMTPEESRESMAYHRNARASESTMYMQTHGEWPRQ
mgnify:CR=1 FL=1